MKTTMARWGNSQGIRIPREICTLLGIEVGDQAEMDVNIDKGTLVITFEKPKRKYARRHQLSMEEFAGGWNGGKVGEEWGGPDIGAEVVE